MLPRFNPYKVAFLYLKKRKKAILKWSLISVMAIGLIFYSYSVGRKISLKLSLKRPINYNSPDILLRLKFLDKKWLNKGNYVLSPPPSYSDLFSDPLSFFKLTQSEKIVAPRGRNPQLLELEARSMLVLSRNYFLSGNTKASKESLYQAMATLSRAFLENFTPQRNEGDCIPFPCCGVNPLPFKILYLSAFSLHIGTMNYFLKRDEKLRENIHGFAEQTLIFLTRAKALGIEGERRYIDKNWNWFSIFLPGKGLYHYAREIVHGRFAGENRGEITIPCPFPYAPKKLEEKINFYPLLLEAYETAKERKTKEASYRTSLIFVKVRAYNDAISLKTSMNGMEGFTIPINQPLFLDAMMTVIFKLNLPMPLLE